MISQDYEKLLFITLYFLGVFMN